MRQPRGLLSASCSEGAPRLKQCMMTDCQCHAIGERGMGATMSGVRKKDGSAGSDGGKFESSLPLQLLATAG
jgi:hypothetical protein